MEMEHVVIIGAGPAGISAALYTARGNLDPLVTVSYTHLDVYKRQGKVWSQRLTPFSDIYESRRKTCRISEF